MCWHPPETTTEACMRMLSFYLRQPLAEYENPSGSGM
jgi:hypothetical protein